MKALVLVLVLTAQAHADDHGFTWGAFAGPGYDSSPGFRSGYDLELGKRTGSVEIMFVNRLVFARTIGFELMPLVRVALAPRVYVEGAGGIAFWGGTHSGDFVALPDATAVLSAGAGYTVLRSNHWLLDLRAVYTLDAGILIDTRKEAVSGFMLGPALRFYSD